MLMHVAKLLESTNYIQQQQTQQKTGSYLTGSYLSPASTFDMHTNKDLHGYGQTTPTSIANSISYDYSNISSRLNSSSSEYSPISTHSSRRFVNLINNSDHALACQTSQIFYFEDITKSIVVPELD